MEVSSSTQTQQTQSSSVEVEAMKKAQDVQAQQVMKVLESANEQSQQTTAQKTGVGGNINFTA